MTMTPDLIRTRFAAERAAGKRQKDAAEALGTSEGAVLAAHLGAHLGAPRDALHTAALRPAWLDLLRSLEPCGPLLALTRNEAVVHEKTGPYVNVGGDGHVALALGEQIDLRLFLNRWHAGFVVQEPGSHGAHPKHASLQFFDTHGTAVHKVFPRPASDLSAWQAVLDAFTVPAGDGAADATAFSPAPAPAAPAADERIDAGLLESDWAAMTDTHEFFGLLKRHGAERQQALRLVEGRFTQRVPAGAVKRLLEEAALDALPIMVFVGNPGCIQIHTGPVQRIEPLGPWLNVLDEGFNLHLREDRIGGCWVVEKPTSDGVVTSLEVFDREGGALMVQFFGARKPGIPEKPAWRSLVARLPRADTPAGAAA
jgi:putative hemin transport protein